jgi:pimeloyl-ACP methyl ester carboxylesterase
VEAWPEGRDAATESTELMAPRVLKRTGLVAGAAAGALGLAYATERALVARIRHRDDPDAGLPMVPEFDEMRVLETHDGGTLYTISRGGGSRGGGSRGGVSRDGGATVVFCHGVTLSSRVWTKQFEAFPAAGFRAVAFDSRGHGESVAGETGHSLDNLADDLRTVLEGLDLHDVILVGHSMGGMAVQAFAIRHPDVLHARVRGLVLQSTSAHNLVSDARRIRETLERITRLGPDFGTFMRPRNLGFLLARIGFGDDPYPSHVEATRQMLAACDDETTRAAVGALLRLDLTEGLAGIDVPTLVLVGTADALTPPRDSQRIADLVPDARLVEYPGAGHMLMYERTAEVDALIMDFARMCLGDQVFGDQVFDDQVFADELAVDESAAASAG